MPWRASNAGSNGKDAQDVVDAGADFFQAFGAPGPDRGADKVHGFDACGTQITFQVQVEIRGVHANKQIGWCLQQTLLQLLADAHDLTVAAQQFPAKAVHRQFVVRPPGLETLALHAGPADTGGQQATPACMQALQQQPGQQVARGLARHHGQARRRCNGRCCCHRPQSALAHDAALRVHGVQEAEHHVHIALGFGMGVAECADALLGLVQCQVFAVHGLVHALDRRNTPG